MKTSAEITELLKTSKHFCILPWIHFHAWPDGKVMPCCVADSDKPVSNVNNQSIINMMNSADYKAMRLAMLDDKPLAACTRCYDIEKFGMHSLRNGHNDRRGLSVVEEISKTNDDGSINDFNMKYMDIRFSNICNMKCRSCGPSCSSLWAQEYVEHNGLARLTQYFGLTKPVINNNEDQVFLTKLKPYLNDVEEVYFAGGEILITAEHYECLDYWLEHNLQDKVELTYTTNFSSLKYKDKDLIDYWSKFPKLKIWASLDAMGDLAELMRKGTDWNKIIKNIHTLREKVPHAEFQITPTVGIWNVYQIPEFFDYLIDNNLISTTTAPRINIITYPWYANVLILPEFSKTKLIKLYGSYIEKYASNIEIQKVFRQIQHTIQSGSPLYGDYIDSSNKLGILEFIKFNDKLDKIRSEKLLDVVPELKEVFEWAKS